MFSSGFPHFSHGNRCRATENPWEKPGETEARHGAVQATGGFIGKEQGGLRQQLCGESQAAALPAWTLQDGDFNGLVLVGKIETPETMDFPMKSKGCSCKLSRENQSSEVGV